MNAHDFHPNSVVYWAQDLEHLTQQAANTASQRQSALDEAREHGETLAAREAQIADLRHVLRQADPEHADRYADPAPDPLTVRERRLRDWLDLLDYLQAHPEFPVGSHDTFHAQDDWGADVPAASPSDVERLAAVLGAEVKTYASHCSAEKWFGDTVALRLHARMPLRPVLAPAAPGECPDERMDGLTPVLANGEQFPADQEPEAVSEP